MVAVMTRVNVIGVDLAKCNGVFDLDSVRIYNWVNSYRCVINSFENTSFNFSCEVGLIYGKTNRYLRDRRLKPSIDCRNDHVIPVRGVLMHQRELSSRTFRFATGH